MVHDKRRIFVCSTPTRRRCRERLIDSRAACNGSWMLSRLSKSLWDYSRNFSENISLDVVPMLRFKNSAFWATIKIAQSITNRLKFSFKNFSSYAPWFRGVGSYAAWGILGGIGIKLTATRQLTKARGAVAWNFFGVVTICFEAVQMFHRETVAGAECRLLVALLIVIVGLSC